MTAWMVRAEGGLLFDGFVAEGVVAIGFEGVPDVGGMATREAVAAALAAARPGERPKSVETGAAQLWRFAREMREGDLVVTYDPARRLYATGRVTSGYLWDPRLGARLGAEAGSYAHHRRVVWEAGRIPRDALSAAARNSLGSTLTLFRLPEAVEAELRAPPAASPEARPETAMPGTATPAPGPAGEPAPDPYALAELETRARERIKDRVARLGWEEMQQLVAGVLRAMGYKTRVSPGGSDRGRDILASPDGLGLEEPRIAVEVKHRPREQTGAPDLRSFIGGRHEGEKGLFVSTGGFTKEALYEAERAKIPLSLLTLEELVALLLAHYEDADDATRQLVPLRRLHWPVD